MHHENYSAKPPLREAFRILSRAFGPQHWWPARTRFEMMVGAVLTQNTAWTNVEKAIAALRAHRVLTPRTLHSVPRTTLARWIRPAGYYNVKAQRLHNLTEWILHEHGGSLRKMFQTPTPVLRAALLAVNGIGPETADCILLYAGQRPVFVVDAYTRRVLSRHGWIAGDESYDEIAALFVRHLPCDAKLYNEYHALIVEVAKRYCRTTPRCGDCPLRRFLPT